MYTDQYVRESLELHLFSGRIMKEHALFLEAGFTPANAPFSRQAEMYKKEFEKLLHRTIELAGGSVSPHFWNSEEAVTTYTAEAERQTENFTGIQIDGTITAKERRMRKDNCTQPSKCQIRALNQTALRLLDGLICFKETVLQNVLTCRMFTMNYPLLIEHIIREAKMYRENVEALEQTGHLPMRSEKEEEAFWNQIMMEHALFIRGLLDPTQEELIRSADEFAKAYEAMLKNGQNSMDTLEETMRFAAFKTAGTKGILDCQIRSVILPLLADHVLREANHYLRVLKKGV